MTLSVKRAGSTSLPVADGRRSFAALVAALGEPVEGVESHDEAIGGVPVRVYAGSATVVAFFHGGGFVFGDLDTHDTLCRGLARASGATIVAVGYRRAPEHPFPAPLEDCAAVTASLGDGVVVAGDSAGGNLAAAVAQRVEVAGQVLLYPMIVPPATAEPHPGDSDLLTQAESHWFWQQYGGPGLTADRAGAAPACFVVAGIDPLRDEALAYARALGAADVLDYPDMAHGFMLCTREHAAARDAIEQVGKWIAAR